jgi:uridine kinase
MSELTIILPNGEIRHVPEGTRVGELFDEDRTILAASVGNLTVPLDYRLIRSAAVRPIRYADREGNEIYRRSLSFLLAAASKVAFPDSRVVIGHSLSNGYYYDLYGADIPDPRTLERLETEMRRFIEEDRPFLKRFVSVAEAIEVFERAGREEKVQLLKRNFDHDILLYSLDGFSDIPIGPLVPSTGRLSRFSLVPYPPGFVLRFPDKRQVERMPEAADQTRLFAVYHESKKWSQILKIQNVGELNEVIAQKRFPECVQVAEALHEKKIAAIADAIVSSLDRARLVFIAGPSSSGKTTFAKRLCVQLRVQGLRPIVLGLDDYFLDREKTPRGANGDYDFEVLEALQIDLFNDHLVRLLAGEEVGVPRFDFKSGLSIPEARRIRIEEDQVLIVEGIHGLNDRLTPRIAPEKKFRIYVSALTQLSIDDYTRIPTTDTRMIRRIVRDHHFRGYSACETIRRWPSVTRGEARHIFPFQERADVIFNTALIYELAVLKAYARRALEEAPPDQPEFAEARRMLAFLHLFTEVEPRPVPPTSILREFIGDSSFEY